MSEAGPVPVSDGRNVSGAQVAGGYYHHAGARLGPDLDGYAL